MCCGSPLRAELKRAFAREFNCHLIELYGLTEGLITILEPEDFERKIQSVGKPVLGSDIRILDENDREVAPGETGEIVGRGRLVMAGYHARDEANREATWIDASGAQWLRTGDLGRLDAEGFLYIVDRKKDMILSGGQNIYPTDIESCDPRAPGGGRGGGDRDRQRALGGDAAGRRRAASGRTVSADELFEWTNARVGKQQRISGVVWRNSLPRNPNGKVLKRELRREYANAAHRNP